MRWNNWKKQNYIDLDMDIQEPSNRQLYRAGQKGFGQVSWMLQASSGRSDKQLQE